MNHLRIYRYQAEKPMHKRNTGKTVLFLPIHLFDKNSMECPKLDTTTKAIERMGALFLDPKHSRYEKQIADLRDEIEAKDKDIKSLQREIATYRPGTIKR